MPTTADAAFRVLTNASLFRLIPQWVHGWPLRLFERWLQIQTLTTAREAERVRNGVPLSYRRRVELFMRELMVQGDAAMLRLAMDNQWRDERGELQPFPVKELQFAVRSGDPETVRCTFEYAVQTSSATPCGWLWDVALAHDTGDCALFDVLHEFVPTTMPYWSLNCNKITSVWRAQWIIDTLGPSALPWFTLREAADAGNFALVQFLSTIPNQDRHAALRDSGFHTHEIRNFLLALPREKPPQRRRRRRRRRHHRESIEEISITIIQGPVGET